MSNAEPDLDELIREGYEREAVLVRRLDSAEARVARLEAALQQLRIHATNPEWTTPAGALALVNEIEAALAPPEDDRG
jgi:hypothetical protein